MTVPAVNYLAVLAAAVVIFILGGLWYSPVLFVKRWLTLQGRPGTVDLLATGNHQPLNAALERYIAQYEAVLAVSAGLEPVQLGVQPAVTDQVGVRAAFHDPAAGDDQNQVRHPHGRKAVADEQRDRA